LANSTHPLHNQQVHVRIPRVREHVRYSQVSTGSNIVYSGNFLKDLLEVSFITFQTHFVLIKTLNSLCLSLSLTLTLCLSHSLCLPLSLSLSVSHSLSLCLSLSFSHSHSLSLTLSLAIPLLLSITLTVSLAVSPTYRLTSLRTFPTHL
jgi:hypothetical protein